jgi:hypothetical protein
VGEATWPLSTIVLTTHLPSCVVLVCCEVFVVWVIGFCFVVDLLPAFVEKGDQWEVWVSALWPYNLSSFLPCPNIFGHTLNL